MILKRVVSACGSVSAARGLEAACYALAAFALAGGTALAVRYGDALTGPPLEWAPIALIAILAIAFLITLFSSLAELFGQQTRDLAARDLFTQLQSGEPAPSYALYLRPFAATGAIDDADTTLNFGATGLMISSSRSELEGQIERAVRPLGRLVALGIPLEHIGAGRIRVPDESWKEAIRLLMDHARLIVMLPSSRAGTLQEIGMILDSELIKRTVIIDPPNIRRSAKGFEPGAEWTSIADAFQKHGFTVPRDNRHGALLFYGDQRTPMLTESLDINADDSIERLFRRVVRSLEQDASQGAKA